MQSLSDILSDDELAYVRQTPTLERPITPNTSTPERPITPSTSTPERLITLSTSTRERERPITPSISTPERLITPGISIPKKLTSQKRKQPSGVEEKLGNAVDILKNFVTQKNTTIAEDKSLKYFCDSLYGDLKNLNKKNLILCKMKIMQVISKYAK